MKMIVEKINENDKWLIIIEDMLGKRKYTNIEFYSKDDAFEYIKKEFKNNIDFNIDIKE